MKSVSRYVILFAGILALACLLQFLAGLVPQQAVRDNLLASMEQLKSEGLAPGVLYEGHPRSKLDNLSENYILTYSYYMDTRTDPASILTNPGRQIQDPYDELFLQTETLLTQQQPSDTNYVRYWLGFRMIVRPMLAIMNYMDARQCIQWGFVLLFAAVTAVLARRSRTLWIPMAFAAAISQLNPIVIASCFQYSAVFYLALIGMLLVPVVRGRRFTYGMLFFAIGMATQIFDFYTAPLITFGLPALMLLLFSDGTLSGGDCLSGRSRFRLLCVCLATWLAGYVGAWFGKMLLTTLFTGYNALADGLGRLAFWMKPSAAGKTVSLLPLRAVYWNFINLLDLVPSIVEAGILIWFVIRMSRRGLWKTGFVGNWQYLALAALPFVWFMVAAKPSYEQFYFQYRSLGMFLMGGLLFLIKASGIDCFVKPAGDSVKKD